jgi:hypothetical protein
MLVVAWIGALVLYISYGDRTNMSLGVPLLVAFPIVVITQLMVGG